MKISKVIVKNFKLLVRNKSSAFIVILGPLLIMILVGLALNKPTNYDLSIGYYTPDINNSLTDSFMHDLGSKNYLVVKDTTQDSCIENIKRGTTNICIIFPKGFKIGNNDTNLIKFYVDYSRTNFVYQIIGSISKKFNVKTEEFSKDLTQILLTKILTTKKDLNGYLLSSITLKTSIDSVSSDVSDTKSKSSELDFSTETISLSDLKKKVDTLYSDAKSLKSKGISATDASLNFAAGSANSSSFEAEIKSISDDILSIYNKTPDTYDEFENELENITGKISVLKSKLSAQESKNKVVINKLDDLKVSLNSIKSNIDELKGGLESTNANLENIDIVNAENIVSPIRTEIKPVVSESNQLIFMFPYLLMLVIMFIGIMLSSNLIMMEKSSRAVFRNFTTPTKEEFFILATFITSFIIILFQVIIVLGLAAFFIEMQPFNNLGVTSIIILLSITLFILIGMIIGYFSKTQESATMLSISLGSIFLLLSNLILPVESMSLMIKQIIKFNPYIVSSEIFKKAFLFNATYSELLLELVYLTIAIIGMIILVFIVNKISKINLFKKTHKSVVYLPEDAYLRLDGFVVRNKEQLLVFLEEIDDKKYLLHTEKQNEIADWVSFTLKDKKLAWKLRFKDRENAIKVLKKYLNKK